MAIHLNVLQHSLPVAREMLQGESGMGFLLRSAVANGMSLHALRDLAGISSVRTLWAADARAFAGPLGMRIQDLESILVEKGRYEGESAYLWHGHVFVHTEQLRVGKPQVCVYCVHRTGYCRALWDCNLYSVCHIHKTPLTAVCVVCRKSLRWFRPAVDVCQCGVYLQPANDEPVSDESAEYRVATWIAKHLDRGLNELDFSVEFPEWMVKLSLDGLCTLLQAFGVHSLAHQRVVNSSLARAGGGFWQGVCTRALQRLADYRGVSKPTALSPFVWEGCLEGLALAPVVPADRQVAILLLRDIFGVSTTAKMGSRRSGLCQMRLFED